MVPNKVGDKWKLFITIAKEQNCNHNHLYSTHNITIKNILRNEKGFIMPNSESKFYICEKCHVILEAIEGDPMAGDITLKKLTANTSDGAHEKHMPIVEKDGNKITVKVGSVYHPMTEEHSIEWVYLETEKGCQRMNLQANEEPVATFLVADGDRPVAVYSYCNLHGFWKTDI